MQLREEVVEGLLQRLHVLHVQAVLLAGRGGHLLADPLLDLLELLDEPGDEGTWICSFGTLNFWFQ